MLLIHYLINSYEFTGLGREVYIMLQNYIRIFIKRYLQLLLLTHKLHLTSSQQVVVADD
jgi:hypothetical protein